MTEHNLVSHCLRRDISKFSYRFTKTTSKIKSKTALFLFLKQNQMTQFLFLFYNRGFFHKSFYVMHKFERNKLIF